VPARAGVVDSSRDAAMASLRLLRPVALQSTMIVAFIEGWTEQ
jgi:hypothetical protein